MLTNIFIGVVSNAYEQIHDASEELWERELHPKMVRGVIVHLQRRTSANMRAGKKRGGAGDGLDDGYTLMMACAASMRSVRVACRAPCTHMRKLCTSLSSSARNIRRYAEEYVSAKKSEKDNKEQSVVRREKAIKRIRDEFKLKDPDKPETKAGDRIKDLLLERLEEVSREAHSSRDKAQGLRQRGMRGALHVEWPTGPYAHAALGNAIDAFQFNHAVSVSSRVSQWRRRRRRHGREGEPTEIDKAAAAGRVWLCDMHPLAFAKDTGTDDSGALGKALEQVTENQESKLRDALFGLTLDPDKKGNDPLESNLESAVEKAMKLEITLLSQKTDRLQEMNKEMSQKMDVIIGGLNAQRDAANPEERQDDVRLERRTDARSPASAVGALGPNDHRTWRVIRKASEPGDNPAKAGRAQPSPAWVISLFEK